MRRYLSLLVALAMMMLTVSSAVEAALGTWLSPPPGQVITGDRVEVAVGFNTQSDVKVTELELWVDGRFYGKKYLRTPSARGVCSFWWYTGNAEKGPHDLVVKIFAKDELLTTVSGVGTVGRSTANVAVPTVTFANIKSGDVLEGVVDVKLNVSGEAGNQVLVSLLVDDLLKLLKNTPPYIYKLDTTAYSDGEHELKTYAYDVSGNKSDPAVVNVTFKNGIERPVVSTLSVDHTTSKPALDESDVASYSPAKTAPVVPAVTPGASNSSHVGRASGEPAPTAGSVPTAPIAAGVDGTNTAALPDPVISHSGSSPKQPPVSGEAVTSGVQRQAVSSVPHIRTSGTAETLTASAPAEPAAQKTAVSSGTVRVAVAPKFDIRASDDVPGVHTSTGVPADAHTGEAAVSGTVRVAASYQPDALRAAEVDEPQEHLTPVSAAPPAGDAAVAAPKRIQVALAPTVRGTQHSPLPAGVGCPAPVERPTKARLQKPTPAVSGDVKARDLFEGIGGVLMWDGSTKTVTVYLGGSIIKLKIGSKIAEVDGKKVELARVPYIVNGRTFIDGGFYAQVCAIQ